MNGHALTRKIRIVNPQGLHMRPVTLFAQKAAKFQSDVSVAKGEQRINGKSAFELMFLAAEHGTELLLEVSGPDAAEAMAALAEILAAASFEEPDSEPTTEPAQQSPRD